MATASIKADLIVASVIQVYNLLPRKALLSSSIMSCANNNNLIIQRVCCLFVLTLTAHLNRTTFGIPKTNITILYYEVYFNLCQNKRSKQNKCNVTNIGMGNFLPLLWEEINEHTLFSPSISGFIYLCSLFLVTIRGGQI